MTQGDNKATAVGGESKASREAYYDGVRGIAIGLVLTFHWLSSYLPWFHGGYVGVDIFFVLSGFIITTILWRRHSTGTVLAQHGAFLRNRVRRLYPALLGLLVGGTLLNWAFDGTAAPVGQAVRSAVIAAVEASSPAQALGVDTVSPFGQTWSLSVEWLFYLAWPVVLLRAKHLGAPPERLAAWAVGVAAFLYAASLLTSPEWFYFGLTSRTTQILLGSALSLWALSGRPLPQPPPRLIGLAVVLSLGFAGTWAVLGPEFLEPEYRYVAFPLITLAALALLSVPLLAPGSWAYQLLSWRPLALLGLVSYSLYLWHQMPEQLLDKDLVPLPFALLGALAVGMVAALTTGSYLLLERPFTRSRSAALQFATQPRRPDQAGLGSGGVGQGTVSE